jgi:hypothetical protein
VQIWRSLIEELQPDILLISIPQHIVEKNFGLAQGEFMSFTLKKDGKPRKNPYIVLRYEYHFQSGRKIPIIFGQAANKPFGTLTNFQKKEIGEKLCHLI